MRNLAAGCPRCLGILQKRLVGRFEKTKFHVDQCFACGGYWLDRKELEYVLALKFPIVRPARDNARTDRNVVDDPIRCPQCRRPMAKTPSRRNAAVVLDYCAACEGYWADGGELEILSRRSLGKRLVDAVIEFFTGWPPRTD